MLLPLEKAKELTVEVKDIAHSLTESDAECSLGIRDQIILCLLHKILQLMSGSSVTTFYLDLEPLSKYSPVTLNLSAATRINCNWKPCWWDSEEEVAHS